MKLCATILAAAAFLVNCSGPYSGGKVAAAKESSAATVQVETVTPTTIPEIISANGELSAEEQATISAKVPGRVSQLFVDLGSTVRAGDPVAHIERDDYGFRVSQAEALVEQTRARLGIAGQPGDDVVPENTAIVRQAAASLKEARFIHGTVTQLQKDGVSSRIDMEKAGVALQAAEARYQGALEEVMQLRAQLSERRAQLALARQQLADCEIKAPFAGSVTRRIASIGEYMAVNGAVAQLVRQHPLRVRLEVPERFAGRIRPGQRIDVSLESSPLKTSGRVVRLSPAIQAQNRSLVIEGEIPNTDGALRPGAFVEGTITLDAGARGVAVPSKALVSFAGVERMFVVSGKTLDERLVRTGRRLKDGRIEVVSGLAPGDRLVINAHDRMLKGMQVRVE
ncbi:MAG: efflux RND transporter periplasmic adaptor subunit [Acidobacteria bacterium]|nr:efflux RND transporter periplasmic adaptor subunit [Acidobacteriota bacterium]